MSDTITNYRCPKPVKLTVAAVYLKSYFKPDDQGLVDKTRILLEKHNLFLDFFPVHITKSDWNTISLSKYIEDDESEYTALYLLAKEKIKQMGCTFLIPQIVVFGEKIWNGYGIAPRIKGQIIPRLIMVQSVINDDKMTLLHELGHAAGLNHDYTPGEPRNFMHEADGDIPRTVMYKYQVEALARAPFAIG